MGNPYSNDLMVDQVIGSAYQVVKYVAANMELLIELSESIPTLASYMPSIQEILLHLTAIENVSANIASVETVSTNVASVVSVASNMAALLSIYSNMASILAVPSYISALDWKPSVRVATTANITLSGLQTIDGVALVAGDRVLVKNQSTPSGNGIYVAATGSWSRASDTAGANISTNNMVMVDAGTVAAGKLFRLSTLGEIIIGTTNITWVEFTPPSGSETVAGLVRFATDIEFAAGVSGVAATPEQVQELVGSLEITGEANTLSSEGTGVSLVGTKAGSALGVKSVKAGDNMTIVDDGNGSLVFSSTGSGTITDVGQVIDSILTDGTGILFDNEGNILYEITV